MPFLYWSERKKERRAEIAEHSGNRLVAKLAGDVLTLLGRIDRMREAAKQ